VASSGYLRGRTKVAVVKGGGAQMLLEHADEHAHYTATEDEFEPGHGPLDLSEIRAGIEQVITTSAPGNPVRAQVASIEVALSSRNGLHAKRVAEARMKGFEGDNCGACGNFTLVRNGTCMKCNTCGSTSGCS
jgi:ribonucleoside-diphosphate reductase alpha chain